MVRSCSFGADSIYSISLASPFSVCLASSRSTKPKGNSPILSHRKTKIRIHYTVLRRYAAQFSDWSSTAQCTHVFVYTLMCSTSRCCNSEEMLYEFRWLITANLMKNLCLTLRAVQRTKIYSTVDATRNEHMHQFAILNKSHDDYVFASVALDGWITPQLTHSSSSSSNDSEKCLRLHLSCHTYVHNIIAAISICGNPQVKELVHGVDRDCHVPSNGWEKWVKPVGGLRVP